jgi:ElaB/YqjD/DUF883 family membrane-anchored ribosome-binding protein
MHTPTQAEIEDQIAALRDEVASLTRSLSKSGSAAFDRIEDRASDLYGYVQDRSPEVVRELRKQARHIESTARENPVASIALAAVALLVIGALVRR